MSRCFGSLGVCPVAAWPLKAPQALAEVLKVNTAVREMNLLFNHIGDAGAEAGGGGEGREDLPGVGGDVHRPKGASVRKGC